jgi:hypothetical protein
MSTLMEIFDAAEAAVEAELRPAAGLPRRFVNRRGEVYYEARPGLLRPVQPEATEKGYLRVGARVGGRTVRRKVHHLVLEAFVGPCPDGMECRHKDGDRKNNHVGNLEWGTRLEQAADKRRHGTILRGERHGQAKLKGPAEARAIFLAVVRKGEPKSFVAKKFGVTRHAVRAITSGRTWAHATADLRASL